MTIKSGVASRRRVVPGWPWRRIAIVAGCILLFLIAFAAAARDSIEKMYLERSLASAFGGETAIGKLYHADGGVVLEDVHVQTHNGAVAIVSQQLRYTVASDVWTVTPADLRVTVTVDRLSGDEFGGAQNAAHMLNVGRMLVHLEHANISIVRSADPMSKLEIAGVGGTLDLLAALRYDLHGDVISDTGAYPFSASDATWTAAALPIAPFTRLLGDPDLTVRSGEAHAVAFTPAHGPAGTFTLDAVRGTLAGHALHDLAGPIAVVPDGIGSAGLNGVLDDGTPISAVGEVHDGPDWNRTLASGTRDLRALARMFDTIARQPNHRWMNVETTAPGITFGQYAMATKTVPHVVQLIEVDPSEPTVRFDTALADDHVISKGARTSDLGLRTKAVAGVNGDYFDIGRTYEPQGMLIRSGVLLHGPTDHEALVIDKTNKATFALFHLRGTVTDGTRRYPITLLNSWPTRSVAVITPTYGTTLKAAPGVTFVALEPVSGTQFRVTGVRPMTSDMPVTLGIGFGPNVSAPLPKIGDVLDVKYDLDPPVAGAVAGIGSGPLLLKDGQWFEDKHAPAPDERDVQWPVVAIGTMPGGTLMFAAVDGRHPERAIGMTRPEFADLLRDFGMIDAMALDSGGSVTMVSRAPGNRAITVRNVPSDFDQERYVTDALFVYSSAPLGTIVKTPKPHVEPSPFPPESASATQTPGTPIVVPTPLTVPTP